MTQQRLKAYLSLIQELLTCPSGEEWIRLRQHEDLVDAGLVQAMEQVATTLAQEGSLQEAKFLHNWAGQLHHILTQPAPERTAPKDSAPAYLEFIQALLTASPQQQQALIAANQQLITPGLVHVMRQVSAQLMAQGDPETATYLNQLAAELGKLWQQQHQFEAITPPSEADRPQTRPPFKPAYPPSFKANDPATSLATAMPTVEAGSAPSDEAKPAELIDPWADQPPVTDGIAPATVSPPLAAEVPASRSATLAAPAPEPSQSVLQRLDTHLAEIATALTQISQQLAKAHTLPHPLQHLEALEQAHQCGWMLTSEEVESLIHVKPKCANDQTAFERGNWRFAKAGKVGAQTAWRVEKVTDEAELTQPSPAGGP